MLSWNCMKSNSINKGERINFTSRTRLGPIEPRVVSIWEIDSTSVVVDPRRPSRQPSGVGNDLSRRALRCQCRGITAGIFSADCSVFLLVTQNIPMGQKTWDKPEPTAFVVSDKKLVVWADTNPDQTTHTHKKYGTYLTLVFCLIPLSFYESSNFCAIYHAQLIKQRKDCSHFDFSS